VFNVKSGEVLEKPAEDPIPTYEVRVEGDEIQVWRS
jgi:nitrite reductase/ring-hydroxylating ferredoxin subunit